MRITKEEYEEYQSLKKWAERENILSSVKSITRLEDDIDRPIKKCVAMLALLQCEPTFSCCGFDYDGQPFHKSHQYDKPYIRMKANKYSIALISSPIERGWWVKKIFNEISLEFSVNSNPDWRNPNCIHFSEEIVGGINYLERLLISGKDNMVDEIVLEDTNQKSKAKISEWQYPPKEAWVIRKPDFVLP